MDPGPLPETPPPAPPPAPGWRAALAFFAVLLALVLPDLLAQGASRTLGLAWSELCTMLLPALVATTGSNLRVTRYLGLDRPRAAPVLLGALMGAAGFLGANGVMALWVLLLPRPVLDWVPDVARIFEGSTLTRAVVVGVAALLAPFCEEVAFRGYLQRTLLRGLRPAAAIGLAALLFAARHLDPVRFPALVCLGALFGWLAWRGASLWPAVAAHAVNNVLATFFALAAGDAGSSAQPTLWGALVPLAVGGAAVVSVAAGFRWVPPPSPARPDEAPRRDPDDPSTRFRPHLVPPPLVAAASAGVAALFALLATAAL